MSMKDLPPDARPREKLLARGAAALSDAELLALLLRTGTAGKGVLQMAQELLDLPSVSAGGSGGVAGLLNASAADLQHVKGLGPAKRAELLAVLELARRALAQRMRERTVMDSPQAVRDFWQLHLASRSYEVFAVLFLAAILGFVGAGGLGQLLYFELSLFHYAQASTVIMAMLLLSITVDWSSAALRRSMR
jgi:DNA repair protein RadC